MYERLKKDGMTNVWDRYEAQGLGGDPDKRCSFCIGGTRCDLCSNGPCRADAAKDKRGVCGITADGMAMRQMLLAEHPGVLHIPVPRRRDGQDPEGHRSGRLPIQDQRAGEAEGLAGRLGVDTSGSDSEVALRLCDFVEKDFNRRMDEPSEIVARLAQGAPGPVEEAGHLPGGIRAEMQLSTGSCLTNVDGYYVSLALKAQAEHSHGLPVPDRERVPAGRSVRHPNLTP